MGLSEILALIAAVQATTQAVVDLIASSKTVLSESDRATVEAALADMQAKSDADFAAASSALIAAAQRS